MFVGWIRPNIENDLAQLSKELLCDKHLCYRTYKYNMSLCFGAYDNDKLVGFISAFAWENSILINNFYYTKTLDSETKVRLIGLLLRNLPTKEQPILVLANEYEKELFSQAYFKEYASFYQAIHQGGGVAFHFSHATAKSISGENYLSVANQLDIQAFCMERMHYLKEVMQRPSSLPLCTPNGFLHSYALGERYIKIAPWIMKASAYSDAEKLLRGVLYHRGLKKVIALIPSTIREITDLYEMYKFEFTQSYHLMYLRQPPAFQLDMIYAF
ncbi:MAG: hypothetical protein PHE73_06690 [Sulfurovaceae bacterium]|nr:hypothetical protein [Sulfurovaceae bacterium]